LVLLSLSGQIFQTCSEYGYYQTCETQEDCVFAVGLDTLDKELDLCEDLFGIGRDEVTDNVAASNLCYGADRPGGSRVLFVNGLLDPWSALSVRQDQPEDKTAVVIEGASHCMDMGDDKPDDSAYVRSARVAIAAKLAEWLSLPGAGSVGAHDEGVAVVARR
jgi:serine protease 16